MSIESVRAFFAAKAPDIAVIESTMSSATVTLAAEAYGVEPARIAKTLSLRIGERVVLIVAAGTSRMDNKKLKARFGGKPKMLGLEEVADITGHEVGGVCPFGLKTPLPVYCDISLKVFDVVVPAAGSTHSAVNAPTSWSMVRSVSPMVTIRMTEDRSLPSGAIAKRSRICGEMAIDFRARGNTPPPAEMSPVS